MSRFFRLTVPVAALCIATLLGGCIVVPDRGYYRPAYHWYR